MSNAITCPTCGKPLPHTEADNCEYKQRGNIVESVLAVGQKQRQAKIAADVERLASEFEETRDPMAANECVILAARAALPLPPNVLKWLGRCFEKFHDKQGRKTLEEIMGLSARGYDKRALESRNAKLFADIARLHALNATYEEAAEMVARRSSEDDCKCYAGAPEADSLRQGYRRWELKKEAEVFYANEVRRAKLQEVKVFLSRFPHIPLRLTTLWKPYLEA